MTAGLFKYLFGEELKLSWQNPIAGVDPVSGKKIYKYGRRQKSLAAGGRVVNLRLDDGKVYQVRISGEDNAFIAYVLAKSEPGVVEGAWSRRGTAYGPQFPEEAPAA